MKSGNENQELEPFSRAPGGHRQTLITNFQFLISEKNST